MPFWAAAQLVPQRDRFAEHCLRQIGFEVYLPRLRQPRIRHGRKVVAAPPPLFPGYAFVFIQMQWHAARWSPGVARLVMDGAAPAAVPDSVITALKARERGGLIELPRPPKFRAGDRVKVLHGPFIGQVGLYAGMKPRERVEVLLALLGGSQRVVLGADAVERAP
jgi:transcriptional antiterminator RfaH